jgi:predicted GIY-YIG superfamily endonuclease
MKKHGGHNRRPDAELIEIAQRYRTRTEWAKNNINSYHCALKRPAVFHAAVAHMRLVPNPYSGDYTVYAYEFVDRYVYVGLTFRLPERCVQHSQKGPVFEHCKACSDMCLVIVKDKLRTPCDAATTEAKSIELYRSSGWRVLNKRRAGGLGSVRWSKWTKEAVLADAKRFKTRTDWRKRGQFTRKIAKRMGWFEEAAAHMPRRNLPPQNRKQLCMMT